MTLAGQEATLWTIRIASVLYALAMALWIRGRDPASRAAWTAGCVLYLAHVVAAFQFYHHWSHAAAYRETARQTAEVFGLPWGGGLYFNYIFTALWIGDAARWWVDLGAYRRQRIVTGAIHWFFAFMFFNAVVIFGTGTTRWLGAAAAAGLAIFWWRERR